jgi:hypothetical protein
MKKETNQATNLPQAKAEDRYARRTRRIQRQRRGGADRYISRS